MAINQYAQNTPPLKDVNDGEIRIVVATKEHREGILRLMRTSFLPREPIEAALGTTWEEAEASLTSEVDDALSQPCSFVAVHPTEGVVGFRTSKCIRIDPNKEENPNDLLVVKGDAPTLRIMQHIAVQLMRNWRSDFAKHRFASALQFYSLCVDERFSNRGLAKRMIEESVRLAERLRVDCLFAMATNRISQRVLQKAGFTSWRSMDYKDITRQDTGEPWVLPKDGNICAQWMVKVIGRQATTG